ncbi:MAG: cytochrome c3 family protein [Nitrospirae bacterium]|nr:cytochrome c3 family protein [Nitrospirota bacterium]
MRYLILIILLVVIMAIVAYTLSDTPHSFSESECKDCHIDPDRDPTTLREGITKLCARCHKRTIRASTHPVDIFPNLAKIPNDLPLRNGKLTCSTCHSVHAERSLVFGIKSYFLRRPTADIKFFCVACHEENRMRPGHKELITTAHMGSYYEVVDPSLPLDPLSSECIGCHDGTIGINADYSIGDGIWTHRAGMSHPIGIRYSSARAQGSKLTPPSQLNRKLRFFAGKIGCGTCHDTYSTHYARLVMDNTESRLCTACHYDK